MSASRAKWFIDGRDGEGIKGVGNGEGYPLLQPTGWSKGAS